MSINIKELYKSDLDPASPSLWWSSKKVEKLNWNFDQIELFDGGPYGPQGFGGKTGFEGVTGTQGTQGTRGFQGRQGAFGPSGGGDWTINTKAGQQNVTLKYIETKANPSNFKIGYASSDTEYVDNDATAVKTYNTKDPLQYNLMFVASNINGTNTSLATRKGAFFNLYASNTGNATLDSGFHEEPNGIWKFRLSPSGNRKFSFLTPKSSPTEMMELSPTNFGPKSLISYFQAQSVFNDAVRIGSNYYGAAAPGKIATTAVDLDGQLGTVMWKDVNQVLPIFPIGSIIAVDKEFTSTYFNLNKTGVIVDLAAVAGYPGGSTIVAPEFKFNFGSGLSTGKFKGWYLCNGKTWQKGSISYALPNLCGFDVVIDYPIYNDALLTPPVSAVGNINLTTVNRQVLGSAQVKFDAAQSSGTYTYSNGTTGQDKTVSSYIDIGEPSDIIYKGSTTSTQIETSTGKGDGLIYLCFLEEDGFTWSTASSPALVNTISLSYNASGYGSACAATATSYDCNFVTSTWTESNSWTTNTNTLYVSGSSAYAASGWYASGGIARYFNSFTGKFTSRMICPSYDSIQLVYNSAVINSGINGLFSGLTKSTYYIDGVSLASSSGIYTNSSGTTLASAGWYRDSGTRRYWNGSSFQGAVFTENYVFVLDGLYPLGYGTTASSACARTVTIYGYMQSSSSSIPFDPFSSISNLFVGSSSAGSGVIDYADSSYNYSNASISRKCNNSSTGALNSAVSCISSPSPSPGGGSGGGGGTGGGCVLFGTKISMNNGSIKQVQDLLIGDALSSRSIVGLPMLENEKELYNWRSENLDLYSEDVVVVGIQSFNVNVVLSFNDGKLFTSKDHLHLYKSNGLWRIGYAINIRIGDMLLSEEGKEIEISSIVETKGNYLVYRVDVEENDMFIANGILTHNKGGAATELAYAQE
jgi:hypothetical protein